MGSAVPYAIGAKFAQPDRPVIALAGDGAMQMNGLVELLTVRRYAAQWADPRLVVCVFHNNDLAHVTWELRALGGAPKFEGSQNLPDVSYAELAKAMGLQAITVEETDQLGPAWDAALSADGPVVLDVHTDPEVPPIPPHVTYEQAKSTVEAVAKGDPNGWHLIAEIAKNKAAEVLTGSGLRTEPRG